ncbi:hypothetical protein SLS60_012096 [Paraconiothyrium brasiliense]|uniref:Uncharacterized protein n=1 Tax=Paraconiothyrium brasiliense TaxID=300254 RepID=A0ABR3QH03_9PLEO
MPDHRRSIRPHEASVEAVTTEDDAPTVRYAKCLDVPYADLLCHTPDARERWLDVLSYIGFTSEAHIAAAPRCDDDLDIHYGFGATAAAKQLIGTGEPVDEDVKHQAPDSAATHAPGMSVDKPHPPPPAQTPRMPLAEKNVQPKAIDASSVQKGKSPKKPVSPKKLRQ